VLAAGFEEDRSFMSQTWNPKRIPRRRKHGFLSRMATSKGRLVLKSRRNKGRWKLSVSNEHRHIARGHR
jgi:large subunit ribosomal protein L34